MSLDREVSYMSDAHSGDGNVVSLDEHRKKKGKEIPGMEYLEDGAKGFKERAAGIHDPESDWHIGDAIERATEAMKMGEAYQRFRSVLEDEVTKGFRDVDHSYFQELDAHVISKFNPLNEKTKMKGNVAEKYMGEMLEKIVFPAAFGGTSGKDNDQLIKDFTNYAVAVHGSQQKANQTISTVKKLIAEGKTMDAYQQMEDIMKNYMISGYSQDVFGSLMPEDDMDVSKAMTATLADKFKEAYQGKRTIAEEHILPKVQYLFQAYHTNKSSFLKLLHDDGKEADKKHHEEEHDYAHAA